MSSPLLAARTGFAALMLALLTAAAAILGVRLGFFAYHTGWLVMVPATALGLVALALSLWWARTAFVKNSGDGKRLGWIALIGSLAFLYPPLSTVWSGFTLPAIHDASSDPDDPPQFVALAKLRRPGQNGTAFDGRRLIRYQGKEVPVSYALHLYKNGLITKPHTPLLPNSKDPRATMFWRSFNAVKGLGWTLVDYSEKDGRIEATAASPWFGQVSDVVVRVRAAGRLGARTDVRAQSREGATDDGFNIGLVRAFRARLHS
jgi:hypothetical protein